jgi:type II secretory pathway pseudopilin PulG
MARSEPRCVQRQRGDALLESLIAMLLLTVICLALVLALGRSMVAQKYQKALSLAVQGIRGSLQSSGVASGCPPTGTATTTTTLVLSGGLSLEGVQKTCTVTTVTVSINGVARTATVPIVKYSVQAQTLLGPGTLTVSN